jgi:hypothetical protein
MYRRHLWHEIVEGESMFPHKIIQEARDRHTENQMDHVCNGRKFGSFLQDVKGKEKQM